MRSARVRAWLMLAALAIAPGVRAQVGAAVPARPALDNGADTNSAQNYFNLGMKRVYEKPEEASRAFYWASRIDPSSGDAIYAYRVATLLAMPRDTLLAYLESGRAHKKPKKDESLPERRADFLALDSLEYRAYSIDPFVYANLDPRLMYEAVQAEVLSHNRHMTPAQVDFGIMRVMQLRSNRAWLDYAQGRFPQALALYDSVLADSSPHVKKRDSTAVARFRDFVASEVHAQRAQIYYLLDRPDSALIEMTTALRGMREHDSTDVVILYRSKAMYQQALGLIYEKLHKPDLARDAYAQALQEDLSYFAAHTRLAEIALTRSDTATALSEMDLAVQIQPNDPVLRYRYADALVHARRDGDAVVQLRKAIVLDPYYGAPYLLFARIADAEQYTDDAVAEYRNYLAVAARTDRQLLVAKARLAQLTSMVASTPTQP
jgi:tetratricopeptide (TPR) repeat protein